jgi:hypothetical protein
MRGVPVPREGSPAEETIEERVLARDERPLEVRADWFLAANAFLLQALFAAPPYADFAVWCLGVVASWSWLGFSLRQATNAQSDAERLTLSSPVHRDVQASRRARDARRPPWLHALFPSQTASATFGRVVPWTCFVAWLAAGMVVGWRPWLASLGVLVVAYGVRLYRAPKWAPAATDD